MLSNRLFLFISLFYCGFFVNLIESGKIEEIRPDDSIPVNIDDYFPKKENRQNVEKNVIAQTHEKNKVNPGEVAGKIITVVPKDYKPGHSIKEEIRNSMLNKDLIQRVKVMTHKDPFEDFVFHDIDSRLSHSDNIDPRVEISIEHNVENPNVEHKNTEDQNTGSAFFNHFGFKGLPLFRFPGFNFHHYTDSDPYQKGNRVAIMIYRLDNKDQKPVEKKPEPSVEKVDDEKDSWSEFVENNNFDDYRIYSNVLLLVLGVLMMISGVKLCFLLSKDRRRAQTLYQVDETHLIMDDDSSCCKDKKLLKS